MTQETSRRLLLLFLLLHMKVPCVRITISAPLMRSALWAIVHVAHVPARTHAQKKNSAQWQSNAHRESFALPVQAARKVITAQRVEDVRLGQRVQEVVAVRFQAGVLEEITVRRLCVPALWETVVLKVRVTVEVVHQVQLAPMERSALPVPTAHMETDVAAADSALRADCAVQEIIAPLGVGVVQPVRNARADKIALCDQNHKKE